LIVLDTHVLLWAIADSKKLSRAADAAIRRSRQVDGLAISAISLWELASLVARGRIRGYGTVESSVKQLIEGVTIKLSRQKSRLWPPSFRTIIHTTQLTA
jgi:PIN domain nuclease of toxin-antitoxin system